MHYYKIQISFSLLFHALFMLYDFPPQINKHIKQLSVCVCVSKEQKHRDSAHYVFVVCLLRAFAHTILTRILHKQRECVCRNMHTHACMRTPIWRHCFNPESVQRMRETPCELLSLYKYCVRLM